METLSYRPWQRWAAWKRLLALSLPTGFFLALSGEGGLPFLLMAIPPAFYLFSTALAPILRSSFTVALEPEGIRVGSQLYPKERFSGVEGPLGLWTRWEVRPGRLNPYRLRLGWRLGTSPLFQLVFGEEKVPLWLDLPGWDLLLLHLGLDWKEHPGLREYLGSARGLAWLNGLLHPPAELEGAWEEARKRYRQVSAWAWVGIGCIGLGFLGPQAAGSSSPLALLFLALPFLGMLLLVYPLITAFNIGRGRPGWAVAYSPFGPLEERVQG
ncbi:hypothetical protein KZX47_01080 [Thermus sp. SYSU G05001]|uniref:DUF58 domain-containing protein n=1 Tax=Thermus brevis TaxID=2862456 RepID=A0ABS6ZUM7_9DEIN|nr:hypothetical protein [Thermus brevis]MBW6393756.1 hypothetical protein [Thermus brevis]